MEFKWCIKMGITIIPRSYYSTLDDNEPTTKYIFNPGAKCSMNKLSTHFVI